jgi:hypothetical protein
MEIEIPFKFFRINTKGSIKRGYVNDLPLHEIKAYGIGFFFFLPFKGIEDYNLNEFNLEIFSMDIFTIYE